MKILILLMTICMMQVSASTFAQRISLQEKNASLTSIFQQINKQSGISFLVSNELLVGAKTVNISVKNEELDAVLESVFKGQPLTYEIKDNVVVVTRKAPSFLERLADRLAAIDVRGMVRDEKGLPLPGATIKVKHTQIFGKTNAEGAFFLKNIDADALLEISYVGYISQELKAMPEISVSLKPNIGELNEVGIISTGYQKIKKDQLTGAASVVSEKQYQQRVAVTGNFLESLEGKVPGLVYNAQSGDLSIRGVSTFDAVKKPLIVLDGFPTEIDIRTINPNDIVSVSVLRDAAAASIYGVRASNGVIIVETRRGKSGKPVFSLTSTYAIQDKPDFGYLNYASSNEYVQVQRKFYDQVKPSYDETRTLSPFERIFYGMSVPGVSNPLLTQAEADEKLRILGSYDNLKEYEKLFYQKRQARNVDFNMSGGNDKSTYMLGLNYIKADEVKRRSENEQLILNIANTYKLSERFNFDFKGTYANSSDQSGVTPNYSDFFPYEHLADENGVALPVALSLKRNVVGNNMPLENEKLMGLGLYDTFYYPYRELTSNTTTNKGSAIRFQGRLNAKVTNWLNIDMGGSYESQNGITDNLQLEDSYNIRSLLNGSALKDKETGRAVFKDMPQGSVLTKTNQKITNYTVRAQANLSKKFGDNTHDFSGIFGVEQRKTVNHGYKTTFFGYDGQTLILKPVNLEVLNSMYVPAFEDLRNIASFRTPDYFGETDDDRRFISYYGQGTYIFKEKYVATGSFRIDKSNLFGVDPKYRNKPLWSAGVSWIVGREAFIKKIDWIDDLKLRVSTGFNGNTPSSSGGAFLILSRGLNYVPESFPVASTVQSPENQSLRWETTRTYNVGMDYSVLNGLISGSVEWYSKKTTDVFGQFDADPTVGFNMYKANTSSISNKGLEILVNSLNVKGQKFAWSTQLTGSFNKNEVLDVKATNYRTSRGIASGNQLVKGKPIGALYSYNYGGLDELGKPYVFDKNGKKVIPDNYFGTGVDVGIDDMIYNGTTTPKYVIGLNNQFKVGAFDLSFLLMYYGGHVMRVEQPYPSSVTNSGVTTNVLKGISNYWQKAGDEENTRTPGFGAGYALAGYEFASEYVRKADFIRLRDVVVTYHARAAVLEKIGLKNTQFRLQLQNPFRYTFSGNDIDPDAINRVTGTRMLETQPFYSLTFSTNF